MTLHMSDYTHNIGRVWSKRIYHYHLPIFQLLTITVLLTGFLTIYRYRVSTTLTDSK